MPPFDVAPRAREPDHSPTRAAGVCGADTPVRPFWFLQRMWRAGAPARESCFYAALASPPAVSARPSFLIRCSDGRPRPSRISNATGWLSGFAQGMASQHAEKLDCELGRARVHPCQ